jgi:sigma-E factor negative regulatory protein RseC
MIKENATVVDCDGEFAWVEAQRQSTCGQCSVNKGCGTYVLSKVIGTKVTRVRALNHAHAKVGDEVTIGMPEATFLKTSMLVYMLPLFMMIGMAMLGRIMAEQLLWPVNLAEIIFGLSGLILSLWWLKRFNLKVKNNKHYQPVVLQKNISVILNSKPNL